MSYTYITTRDLAKRIHYHERTIRNCLKDTVLIEGVHYFHPFGGRKILFIWENIERDMNRIADNDISIPMASGGTSHA